MKTGIWASVSLVIIVVAILLLHGVRGTSNPKPPAAARAQERARETNVDLRERVDDVFQRADARAREGRIDEAISLYQRGLQVNPWRLEYQLKLARLWKQIGLEEQAVERALTVRQYAERGDLIAAADELIRDANTPQDEDEPSISSPALPPLEIVLVPIDKVDARLLADLRDSLQSHLGLRFTIAKTPLSLGGMDRTYAQAGLPKLVEKIKAAMPEEQYRRRLQELGFTEDSLKQYYAQVQFVEAALRDAGRPREQIDGFRAALEALQQTGQYDAERLLTELKQTHPLSPAGPVKGYLGVAEADLFTRDYNFLYGWGGRGYAVMSYHRYTAAFNQEPPNRPRLLERTVKQAISSTFHLLDIPRCTSPTCVRAYPHSLVEHDQKTGQLCPDCRRALALTLARSR
jgi:predicted Zn-dependent protease